jgi:actin, other eukaryote
MDSTVTAIIVDSGSSQMKIGLGGEDAPRSAQPNVAGRTRHPGVNPTILGNVLDNFCGDDALANEGLLQLNRPVQRGLMVDWDAMEASMHYSFLSSLRISCDEHPLLMTEAPDCPRMDREKLTQMMFEVFNVPALCIGNSSVLGLYSTGRTTGLVVDSGAGKTHIGPVWEGYCYQHYLQRVEFAGDDLTGELVKKLRKEGYPFSTPSDIRNAEAIKKELCYLATSADKELAYCKESRSIERLYALPDGQEIYMNENRFMLPEMFFSPGALQCPIPTRGWHELIQHSIDQCELAVRPEMYSNIVLIGGNTLFPRLDERVQKEMSLLAPKGVVAKCVAFPNRQYSSWVGGSILASMSTFPCMWVSKSEYDDYGASIVHRKC